VRYIYIIFISVYIYVCILSRREPLARDAYAFPDANRSLETLTAGKLVMALGGAEAAVQCNAGCAYIYM